jgi:hypothetical protein
LPHPKPYKPNSCWLFSSPELLEEPPNKPSDNETATGTHPEPLPSQDKKTMPELQNEAQVAVFCQSMSLEQKQSFMRNLLKMEKEVKEAEDITMLALGDQDKREREGEEDEEPDPKKPKDKK